MTREQAINYLISSGFSDEQVSEVVRALTYETKSYQWCTECKEYDQEKHCCHRWSKVIRNTVEEMKQEYIEREVLDKIRAEIEQTVSRYSISRERGGMGQVEWSDRLIKESEVLQIFDKYKAETEVDNGNNT